MVLVSVRRPIKLRSSSEFSLTGGMLGGFSGNQPGHLSILAGHLKGTSSLFSKLFLDFRKNASFLIILIFCVSSCMCAQEPNNMVIVFSTPISSFSSRKLLSYSSPKFSIIIKADLINFFDASSETCQCFRLIF